MPLIDPLVNFHDLIRSPRVDHIRSVPLDVPPMMKSPFGVKIEHNTACFDFALGSSLSGIFCTLSSAQVTRTAGLSKRLAQNVKGDSGDRSAIHTGPSSLILCIHRVVERSQRLQIQSRAALSRYRPHFDQLVDQLIVNVMTYDIDCTVRVCPLSVRAGPRVRRS